jgi:MinD-like ATPase involved in chromosome partitioning or flagellar assembly/ActR/RegA family two-component response regulator
MSGAQTNVLLIEDNPADARLIQETLAVPGAPRMDLWWAERLSTGLKQLAETEIDVVLLDLSLPDSQGLETFLKLRAQAPGVPVIVVTGLDDEGLALKAAREGAQDYVLKSSASLQSLARLIRFAIERHKTLAVGPPKDESAPLGRILGFIGAKGGAGATTVALNVAAVLARQRKSVIALELRSCFGAFSFQSHLAPTGSLRDLLDPDAGEISAKALQQRLVSLPCGVKALFGAQTAEGFMEIQPQQAEAILRAAAQMADYVIADLPSHPGYTLQRAVAGCHFTALVVEREPGSVAAGSGMVQLLRSWIADKNALAAVLVIKDSLAPFLALPDIRSQLGCPIAGVIPPAPDACVAACKRGVPLALSDPDSLAAASLLELANRLAEPVLVPVSV